MRKHMPHCYKSEDPTVVGIVQEYFQARKQFQEQLKVINAVFGGQFNEFRDIDLMQGNGVKFVLQDKAYFAIAFPISLADHQASIAAGEPSWGWVEGAVEIPLSEFEAARLAKIGGAARATSLGMD